MQLISQFNQIFSLENLPLTLTTYDVLSLGPSCGIIRMVKDATTMDSLKKTLHNRFIKSLRDFFQ
jgi:phosphatidylinositol 4-kinase